MITAIAAGDAAGGAPASPLDLVGRQERIGGEHLHAERPNVLDDLVDLGRDLGRNLGDRGDDVDVDVAFLCNTRDGEVRAPVLDVDGALVNDGRDGVVTKLLDEVVCEVLCTLAA